jgi:hypothetical protein
MAMIRCHVNVFVPHAHYGGPAPALGAEPAAARIFLDGIHRTRVLPPRRLL